MIARTLRLFAVSLALLAAACGSSGQSTPKLTCQSGQFKLTGTLDGQAVDVTASSEGSGLTQVGTGELTIGADPNSSAPARPQLSLTWPQTVVDGASTAASGTLVPVDGPLAGQSLCVGTGTTVTFDTNDSGVQLELKGFASGSNCDTPVAGDLTGCWQ